VFSLAERTGWSIDYILWDIPLALITQATHTYLWQNGVRCRRRGGELGEDRDSLAKLLGLT